ncbi:MAG: 23S rRNA (guanosine(2251)-2'-O)-methyltransferase RlmB [Oscillospiraceae bacterium]
MSEQKDMATEREDLVAGRNAVLELLKSGRPVECVYLQRGLEGSVSRIAAMARERGIVVKEVAKAKLDYLVPGSPHQGVVAQTSESRYSELEDIFTLAGERGEPPFVILADGIEDPHNLGAIIRTAEAAGAHGIILPKRRSAGLTFVVTKASAGAVEHLPIVRVANLVATMKELKERGIWFYAADLEGTPWHAQDYSGGVGLVVGAEGAGVSRLVRETCDFAVTLPMRGKIQSLNASVAAGIVMYEIAKQRIAKE